MGLFEKLRQELIDIVEWVDDTNRTLVWRFPRYQNEIKHGAQLIVRPGQKAIFIDRGKVADIFEPGMYTLDTANLPILSTLQGWKYGFESPFKAEVYFVSTRQITDLKWGTPNPVMMRDADFGPIRIRAFGTYALKAQDPKALLEELVGTDGIFEAEEVTELLRSIVASAFADMLGEAKIAALDLAGNYTELSEELRRRTQERVDDEYGLEIPQLYVVNISLPEEVEKALDTRTSMGVIGDMGAFQQYQMGQAMTAAANNPSGGGAAEGMGLGMGFAMANQMFGAGGGPGAQVGPGQMGAGQMGAGQMAPGAAAAGGAAPPPLPPASPWHAAVGGQSVGPMPLAQLVQQIQGGQIEQETLVWTAGMEAWSPAGEVPQLAGYFQATPPPLPQS